MKVISNKIEFDDSMQHSNNKNVSPEGKAESVWKKWQVTHTPTRLRVYPNVWILA